MVEPQRVIVTAGASGIGRAIAEIFLDRGAKVAVCDVSDVALADFARDRTPLSAARLDLERLDVADGPAVEAWVARVEGLWGGIDVLINNAGIGGPKAPLEETDVAAWRRTLDVNLTGAFLTTRSAATSMKRARSGSIVNISTSSVVTGVPQRTAYVASKQGLMGLTKNTARELGPFGVRCNALLPGLIDNPRGRGLVDALAARDGLSVAEAETHMLHHISLRTWTDPRDVAEAAYFRASPAARVITGQFIGVCGGVEWEG